MEDSHILISGSAFLRESSLIISIWCPTGITGLQSLKPNLPPPKCVSSPKFPNHASSNILFVLSWSSNLKLAFDYFLCISFLPYMNFLSLCLSWICHFLSGFIDTGISDLFLSKLFRFLDGRYYGLFIFILSLSWLSSSSFPHLPLLPSIVYPEFYDPVNICWMKERIYALCSVITCLLYLVLLKPEPDSSYRNKNRFYARTVATRERTSAWSWAQFWIQRRQVGIYSQGVAWGSVDGFTKRKRQG